MAVVEETGHRREASTLLQELIRVDTVNPPGNESRAASLLRDYLARVGIECEWIAREPERANVVARLSGGDGPSLAFLCHTDTVLADPAEWERDPGEDVGSVPPPRARAERARLDARDCGQRARQGRALHRSARELRAGADTHSRGEGVSRDGARRDASRA